MRIVFDTNVIISVLLLDTSVPGRAFHRSLQGATVLISASLVEELSDVLARDKFDRHLTREKRERFLEGLIAQCELVEITTSLQACRDPQGDHLVEPAVDCAAAYLVTSDRDLLALHPFRGVEILTPAALLTLLESAT